MMSSVAISVRVLKAITTTSTALAAQTPFTVSPAGIGEREIVAVRCNRGRDEVATGTAEFTAVVGIGHFDVVGSGTHGI